MSAPTINAESAIRSLLLADFPNVLSLTEVSRVCGMSDRWAYERARRGELPLLPIKGQKLVAKHELLAWLGADKLVSALADASPDRQAQEVTR